MNGSRRPQLERLEAKSLLAADLAMAAPLDALAGDTLAETVACASLDPAAAGPTGQAPTTPAEINRVKAHFFWDREGAKDDNASCWVRVSQVHSSSDFGVPDSIWIDMGAVTPTEGDPDQPIIVGRIYSPDTMPPHGLPDNKVASGWHSNSSPGGSSTPSTDDSAACDLAFAEAGFDHAPGDIVMKGKNILQN